MEVLKNKKYLGIAGLVFLFLGTVLPFFKIEYMGISGGTVSLLKYWEGYVIIVSVITAAMIIFRDSLKDKIPQLYNSQVGNNVEKYGEKAILAPAAIAALVIIYTCVSVRKQLATGSYVNLNDIVKYGLGFYSSIIGILALAAHGFIYKGEGAAVNAVNGVNNAWQPMQQPMQQPMNNMNGFNQQPMQQDPNMMNQQFAQPQQPMQQNYQQPMQQDPNMNNNQFPNNNQF